MAKESGIHRRILKRLRLVYGKRFWGFKVHGNEFQPAGIPDLLFTVDGIFFALEVKRPGERDNTTILQDYHIRLIIGAGGHSGVVTSVKEAMSFVRKVRQATARSRKSLLKRENISNLR